MKKKLLLFCLLLLQFQSGSSFAGHPGQARAPQITESEKEDVERVAKAFSARLQQTRDLAPLTVEFYLTDFLKGNLPTDAKPSTRFITLDFAPEFPIKPALLRQASLSDWQALYVGYQNLKYFMELTLATLPEKRGTPQNQIFPAEVDRLLKSQAKLAKTGITTVKELRGLNTVLKQAGAMLRAQFNRQPPESSATYHQRIGAFIDPSRKVMQAEVQVSPQSESGFPPQTRFFNIITAAPFFELRLVRTADGLKIVFAKVHSYKK
jgi:hypothetical protein